MPPAHAARRAQDAAKPQPLFFSGVLAAAQPLQHSPAKAHPFYILFFWQPCCPHGEHEPAANTLRRLPRDFSAQPTQGSTTGHPWERDLSASLERWPLGSGACPLPALIMALIGIINKGLVAVLGSSGGEEEAFLHELPSSSQQDRDLRGAATGHGAQPHL